ncbi:MAG: N-acetylmuramoyl-L-alanine amidase, partial [Rhodospirillales bacterium]|nr:N-acetylmuramoyl-L-alanine amidase [Rhodospirillales bacterium]
VLDLSEPALVSGAFMVAPDASYGPRLVLDLTQTTRQAFLTNAGGAPVLVSLSGTVTNSTETLSRVPAAKPLQQARAVSPPPGNSARPPAPRRSPKRVIVLDPGHGGVDPGTTGGGGTLEKYLTLSVAREIKKQLEETGRYKVSLTRSRDVFVRLRKRVELARVAEADLFVSIHADAIKDNNIRGLSVYTLSEKASDKEAAALADKENKADLIAGIDLSNESTEVTNILIDLAQRESMNQSAQFASRLVQELQKDVRLLRNTHRFAGFAVLKAPDVPSVLLELGFLSNREDEKKLRDKKFRTRLAKSILRALDNYFTTVEEARRR